MRVIKIAIRLPQSDDRRLTLTLDAALVDSNDSVVSKIGKRNDY